MDQLFLAGYTLQKWEPTEEKLYLFLTAADSEKIVQRAVNPGQQNRSYKLSQQSL